MKRKIDWKRGSQAMLFSLALICIGFMFSVFLAEIGNMEIAATKAQIQADVVVDAALNNARDIYGLNPTVAQFTSYVMLAFNNDGARFPSSIVMNDRDDIVNVRTGRRMRAQDLYRYGYLNVRVTVTQERIFSFNNRLFAFPGGALADDIFEIERESTGRLAD